MKFLHWNWKNETLKHWNIFGEIHRRMFQLITKEHMSVEDGSADVLEWPLKPTYNAINNKNTLFYTFGKISAFFSFQLFIFFTISSIDPEKIVSKSIQCFVDTKVFQCIKPWNSTECQKIKSWISSSLVWWSKMQKREKKIFFVLLMINLNKFSLLVSHNYWEKKIKKSDYQKCNHACIMHVLCMF